MKYLFFNLGKIKVPDETRDNILKHIELTSQNNENYELTFGIKIILTEITRYAKSIFEAKRLIQHLSKLKLEQL